MPVSPGERMDFGPVLLDPLLVLCDERLPALGRELRDAVDPQRIELRALIIPQELLARNAMALGEPHQAALVADQALVDVVELFDQGIDACLPQAQRLHLGDDVIFELLVFALLRGRERRVLQPVLDVLLLQAAQALVLARDDIEALQHLGLELGLDGGERERILHVVFVELVLAERWLHRPRPDRQAPSLPA